MRPPIYLAGLLVVFVLRTFGAVVFQSPIDYSSSFPSGQTVLRVRVGDVNNDGWADAVGLCGDGTLIYLRNNGAGAFTSVSLTSLNVAPTGTAYDFILQDLNNDGYLDIAVGEGAQALLTLINTGSVQVLKNSGPPNYSFTSLGAVVNTQLVLSLAAADVGNDGDMDIFFYSYPENRVYLLTSTSPGAWSGTTTVASVANVVSLVAGDFANDRKPDVVTLTNAASAEIAMYINVTGGTAKTSLGTIAYGNALVGGFDFNGDGTNDFMALSARALPSISTTPAQIFYGRRAQGGYAYSTATINNALDAAWGDFDNDAFKDLVVAQYITSNQIVLYLAQDAYTLVGSSATVYTASSSQIPCTIGVADFDHDGTPDVVFGSASGSPLRVALVKMSYSTKCVRAATFGSPNALVGNCTAGGTTGQICALECAIGYYVNGVTFGVCQGTPYPSWVGQAVTCTPLACPAIANVGQYYSLCPSSTTGYLGTCQLGCVAGYTGSNVTRQCQVGGTGTWSPPNLIPSCAVATCGALAADPTYTSTCLSPGTTYGDGCTRACASGYSGASVASTCQQSQLGGSGVWSTSTAPSCSATTCAGASLPTGGTYTSECGAASLSVGGTCVMYCVRGRQGSNITHSCGQVNVGDVATWDSFTAPSCVVTTCSTVPATSTYSSTCDTVAPSVDSYCALECKKGYAGTTVNRTCGQSSPGASAAYSTTAVPSCSVTKCAATGGSASYSSTCSTSNVGVACALTCKAGYLGSPLARICVQTAVGAAATWNDTGLPTCLRGCLPLPNNSTQTNNCSDVTQPVGTHCRMACGAGTTGDDVYAICDPSYSYSYSAAVSCAPFQCPGIASGVGYISNCSAVGTVPGMSCLLSCDTGYLGTTVYRVCQVSLLWDTDAPPTCNLATCPSLPASPGGGYDTTCPSTMNYADTCTRFCLSGYQGTSVDSTCGPTGTWDVSTAPSCTATTCSALPAGPGFVSACLSPANVGDSCDRSCASGYAGTTNTHSCEQTATGAAASWTFVDDPMCTATSCPALPSGTTYTSLCATRTTNVSSACVVRCAAGYQGGAVARTCVQSSVGAQAAWNSTVLPACSPISCAAVPNAVNYTTSCSSGPSAYLDTCVITCLPYFPVAPLSRTCQQSGVGGGGVWSPATSISCGAPVTCPRIANTTSTISACSRGSKYMGETCEIQCRGAYVAQPAVNATCQTSGAWDNAFPLTCTLLSCAAPPISGDGVLIGSCTRGTVGTQCSLDCDQWYRPSVLVIGTCNVVVPGVSAEFQDQNITCTYAPAVCGNGIVEATEFCDNGKTAMALPTSCCVNCSFAPPTTLCRKSEGSCDVAEYCDAHGRCPDNAFANSSLACSAAVGECVPTTYCGGTSPLCPTPNFAHAGTPCTTGGDPCLGGDTCVAGTGKCADGPIKLCCGDGHLESQETCDDSNKVSADGCTSECKRELGWTCPVVGQPCQPVTCPQGQSPDCNGDCGGLAVYDGCGECVGGATGLVFNFSVDACGVCFGNNRSLDECGECNGGDRALDACGVCHGDNSTCVGCDGVPHSRKVYDSCGICDGEGTSCLGCNGEPIGSGGVNFDRCGVCGGNGQLCALGCNGEWGSGVEYDCARVCGGSAMLDRCQMCYGGTTGLIEDIGYNAQCARCFTVCSDCQGTVDACGVCNGAGTSCLGCDGKLGVGGAVLNYDACGVCGGNGLSCVRGCDGRINSTVVFDCAGVCGGNATVDKCGVCTGGTTGLPFDFHMDTCGVCFGANRNRDSCGVCFGSNSRDYCGVCLGFNSSMDACGVCYGYNRTMDHCGVCGGDSHSCMGCDNIPNSGKVRDACDVCGGTGCLPPRTEVTVSPPSANLPLYYGAGAGGAALLALIIILVVVRRRIKSRVVAIMDDAAKKEAIVAPTGRVVLAVAEIQAATALWEALPLAMTTALDMYNSVLRQAMDAHQGYEIKTEGDSFRVAFRSPIIAIKWACTVQRKLLEATWPVELMDVPECDVQVDTEGRLLWNGPRVRMGIHVGEVEHVFDKRAMRMDYTGVAMTTTAAIASVAAGGQILVSGDMFRDATKFLNDSSNMVLVENMGVHSLKAVSLPHALFEVLPNELGNRTFPRLRTNNAGVTTKASQSGSDDDTSQMSSLSDQHFSQLPTVFPTEKHSPLSGDAPNLNGFKSPKKSPKSPKSPKTPKSPKMSSPLSKSSPDNRSPVSQSPGTKPRPLVLSSRPLNSKDPLPPLSPATAARAVAELSVLEASFPGVTPLDLSTKVLHPNPDSAAPLDLPNSSARTGTTATFRTAQPYTPSTTRQVSALSESSSTSPRRPMVRGMVSSPVITMQPRRAPLDNSNSNPALRMDPRASHRSYASDGTAIASDLELEELAEQSLNHTSPTAAASPPHGPHAPVVPHSITSPLLNGGAAGTPADRRLVRRVTGGGV